MHEDKSVEYAVWVPDRGYIGWLGNLRPDIERGVTDHADAIKLLESGMNKYVSMGCPEIAETLQIVERTITVIRSDWSIPVTIRRRGD